VGALVGKKKLIAGFRRIFLAWHSPYLERPARAKANVSTQQCEVVLKKDVGSGERVEVELSFGSFLQTKVGIQVCGETKPVMIEGIMFCTNVVHITPR
jgi:hypothetical protein